MLESFGKLTVNDLSQSVNLWPELGITVGSGRVTSLPGTTHNFVISTNPPLSFTSFPLLPALNSTFT